MSDARTEAVEIVADDYARTGAGLDAYLCRRLERTLNWLADRLENHRPDSATRDWADLANWRSGNGHDHDGANSAFIGGTIMSQVVGPMNAAKDNLYDEPLFEQRLVAGGTWYDLAPWGSPTFNYVRTGPGANRVRIFVLGALMDTANTAMQSGTVTMRATAVTDAGPGASIQRAIAFVAGTLAWVELTDGGYLAVEANYYAQGVNLDVQAAGDESGWWRLYGLTMVEAHA